MKGDNVISPLEGEPAIPAFAPPKSASSARRLIAVAFMLISVMVVIAIFVVRMFGRGGEAQEAAAPEVASAQKTALKMPPPEPARAAPPPATPSSQSLPAGTAVPALAPLPGEAQPIPVRGSAGSTTAGRTAPKMMNPDDAPIFSSGAAPDTRPSATQASRTAGSASRGADASMEAYQRQLAGMMENLQKLTAGKTGAVPAVPPAALPAPSAAREQSNPPLLGMDRSSTPTSYARQLPDRSMVATRGAFIPCNLRVRVVSATSGFVGCQVSRNVFSHDGRVVLIDRGSDIEGEYRIASVRPGMTRLPVLGSRLVTPQGVAIDIDSPATGALGESGLGGHVDNRWPERLGGALLLSLTSDAVKYLVASHQASDNSNSTVVLPSTTEQSPKLAEKVLETTINIPPLLYQNQGASTGFYLARDLDFSTVYELKPAP